MRRQREIRLGETLKAGDLLDGEEITKWEIGKTATREGFMRQRRDLPLGSKVSILTHGGRQHADELFAIGILRELFNVENVIRLERDSLIPEATFVLDVGKLYDPENGRFDHHIPTRGLPQRPPERPVAYATSGLVWDYYGWDFVAKVIDETPRWQAAFYRLSSERRESVISSLWRSIDLEIVCPIDKWDLGDVFRPPQIIPLQSLLLHMTLDHASTYLAKMVYARVQVMLAYQLGAEEILEHTKSGEGSKVFVIGDKGIVLGEDRVEPQAAKRFMRAMTEPVDLFATISPLSGKARWVLMLDRPLQQCHSVPHTFEKMGDRKTYFSHDPQALLSWVKQIALQEQDQNDDPNFTDASFE